LARVLIASNRLPITLRVEHGEPRLIPSVGGLATALRTPHEAGGGLWFGWPGDAMRSPDPRVGELLDRHRVRAVPVSAAEMDRYYDSYSNGLLWPLLHYQVDTQRLDADRDFGTYRSVNARFADQLASEYQDGDVIWVHDYHLMLVPGMLRERLPTAKVGFFLHVPFPAADIFRVLPQREEVIRGLLGADLLGFHTASYRHNFVLAAAHVLGIEAGIEALSFEDRHVSLGVYPIGIDVAAFEKLARDDKTSEDADKIRRAAGNRKVLLGVDRLDYTKGLRRRLLAIDRLLEREQGLRDRIHFIQLAVPSREKVEAYADLRRSVNELVGRINAHHGTPTHSPVQLLYRSVPMSQLVTLYRAADVMLVTPLRDGMNLVAKEYIASRVDEDGVLVLSEFAGAAAEMQEALVVNPYDIAEVANATKRALAMAPNERAARMRALRSRVAENDVARWAGGFLSDLDRAASARDASPQPRPRRAADSDASRVERALERARAFERRLILLDYDGTLVPFAAVPELAAPDAELLDLLAELANVPGNEVHLLTGRSRPSVESWLGHLPLGFATEHGLLSRTPDGHWTSPRARGGAWLEPAVALFSDLAKRTPGALVEVKTASVAFHYRRSDPLLAAARLREARERIATLPDAEEAEVLDGSAVLELRARGVHKGLAAATLAAGYPGAAVFAAGDDRTDEDTFAALPEDAVTLRVGRGSTLARFRVFDSREVRALLRALL
jgi:trehalose 6-phosphate synthase/phosphatase